MALASPAWPREASDKPIGETLYNDIRLPAEWPPKNRAVTYEPMPVPYLDSPPAVINIDVGRQLLVDDFLVEQVSRLERTHHTATYTPNKPILVPDKSWEKQAVKQPCPTAMVFSDGVWYDPKDSLYKMWYMAGYCGGTAYATSKDGIHWHKPALDVVPGTNIVDTTHRDSSIIWLDLFETDATKRFKMFHYPFKSRYDVYFSSDGIHWGKPVAHSGPTGDRATVFYNPFRKVWVYSIRSYVPKTIGRCRRYYEHADVIKASQWKKGEPDFWIGADRLDPPRPDIKTAPQLYNLDAVAYESLMIGLFSIWYGQPKDRAKPNEICIGYSRDGYHWHRPMRKPLMGVSERYGDWNWANVQSAGGCCLIVGDQVRFYVSARAGVMGSKSSGVCTTGLATIRRDGFVSMDAGESTGTLTTRTLKFSGKHLFVNADVDDGELRVEALDADGNVIAPFTKGNCVPVTSDKTLQGVRWRGADDVGRLAGKPIRFRFSLRSGKLYSFWVSPETSGASQGYVAAGGPGFTGPTDTIGKAGYRR